MPLATSTLRPGFLVSLKTSTSGNIEYVRTPVSNGKTEDGAAVQEWQTKRTIINPAEHEAGQKARSKASSLVRSVCIPSVFGLLCPEDAAEKLEKAVADARKVIDEFNEGAKLSRISIYILCGRVMPDDAEAVRAISSEIRDLMAEMQGGVENANVDAIRDAASKLKGVGGMLTTEMQTKVQMAVDTGRAAAKAYVADRERDGQDGTVSVDRSAARRISELRTAFLDLSDEQSVAAPKAAPARQLDLAGE
jgi:hypothetical protein